MYTYIHYFLRGQMYYLMKSSYEHVPLVLNCSVSAGLCCYCLAAEKTNRFHKRYNFLPSISQMENCIFGNGLLTTLAWQSRVAAGITKCCYSIYQIICEERITLIATRSIWTYNCSNSKILPNPTLLFVASYCIYFFN